MRIQPVPRAVLTSLAEIRLRVLFTCGYFLSKEQQVNVFGRTLRPYATLEEILRVGPGQAVNASIDDMMDAMSRQPLGRRRGTDWDPFFARRDD